MAERYAVLEKRKKEEEAIQVDDEERDARTVFATALPVRATERQLIDFFSKAGRVSDVRLITDRNSGKSKGFGYIEYASKDSMEAALLLSGTLLMGHTIIVQATQSEKNRQALNELTSQKKAPVVEEKEKPRHERHSSQHARLYVGGLDLNITDSEIKDAFLDYGDVESVALNTDNEGRSKGYAFVQYYRVEDAKRALRNSHNIEISGRAIKVGLYTEAERAGILGELDDDDSRGLSLNARGRVMLMQRLQRKDSSPDPRDISPCILLTNMFDPDSDDARSSGFIRDIEDDVKSECSKYGNVAHISADKYSHGQVYVKFEAPSGAQRAINALQGRYFGGQQISAEFVDPKEYKTKFPSSK